MNDTPSAAAPPIDDIWVTKNPELVAGRGYAWSSQAKPLSSRHNLFRVALFAYMALQLFAVLVVVLMLYLFQQIASGADPTDPTLNFAGNIIVVAGQYLTPASITLFIACVITYLMFVYRGVSNLHLSDARSITVTPGWAVGGTFIPFANIGLIYSAMRQLWIGSHDPVHGKYPPPATLNIWWATYLLSNIASMATSWLAPKDADMQFMDPADYITAFMPSSAAGIISGALNLISCFCLLAIMKQITAAQESLRSTSAFDE